MWYFVMALVATFLDIFTETNKGVNGFEILSRMVVMMALHCFFEFMLINSSINLMVKKEGRLLHEVYWKGAFVDGSSCTLDL